MNTSRASIVGILGRLSTGISRTSIRHFSRPKRPKYKRHHLTGFKPGHGERIFVYNHAENGMVLYSHESELTRNDKALEQIPFTVKKQQPVVLRRDYWKPMCMIQLDPLKGRGAFVGRSVFRQLREWRRLHELSWGWQTKDFLRMNKYERGHAIHNQKSNAVADIAAVLGGRGRGNLMWTTEPLEVEAEEHPISTEGDVEKKGAGNVNEAAAETEAAASSTNKSTSAETPSKTEAATPAKSEAAAASSQQSTLQSETLKTKTATLDGSKTALSSNPSAPELSGTVAKATKVAKTKKVKKAEKPVELPKRLHNVTVYWANDVDLDWARTWSDNVIHKFGLPAGVTVWNWQTKLLRAQYDDQVEMGDVVNGEQIEPEPKKKTWLASLLGKVRGSSSEARV